jgi:hypothetical protein
MKPLKNSIERQLEILQPCSASKLQPSLENTAFRDEEEQRDYAVVVAHRLLGGYSNAQAADASVFAEAIEDMFAKFPIHIQKEALQALRREHPRWMPQPGEVYAICNRLQAEEFDRKRWGALVKQQLEARRADEAARLPYLRPKAIVGPVAPPPRMPRKPSDEEYEGRDSQVRAIWRDVADGKIDEVKAERRIEALGSPGHRGQPP